MLPRSPWIALATALVIHAQSLAPEPVALDLLASDSHGRPVPRLMPADLRISDAGRSQKLLYFRAKEPTDAFPHATVLVLNQFDAPTAFTPGAWDWLVQAIRAYPQPGSLYCYVLTTHGMLYPIHPLPDSWIGAPLPNHSWPKEEMPLYDTIAGLLQPFRKDLEPPPGEPPVNEVQDLADEGIRGVIRRTALQELEARMAPVPGPATIVLWGRPSRGKRYPPDLLNFVTLTTGERLAPVRIYTVGSPKAANVSATKVFGSAPGTTWRELPSSEPRDVLRRVWNELEPRYRIAYLPPAANWDGALHDIRVTTSVPGIAFDFRKQYRAPRPGDLAADQHSRQPDLFALAPHDSTQLRLQERDGELRVDAADVMFLPDGDRFTARLAVQCFRYSADPPAKLSDARVLTLRLTPSEHTVAIRDGILIAQSVPASSRIARVRVVVADTNTGSFGTWTMREQR
jgi:hypothetical protein